MKLELSGQTDGQTFPAHSVIFAHARVGRIHTAIRQNKEKIKFIKQ
jgi:hypothetical protein